jgi:ubiquinone/menaquinone biosynthesis C-methylase UbiE
MASFLEQGTGERLKASAQAVGHGHAYVTVGKTLILMPLELFTRLRSLKHRANPHEILDDGNHPDEDLFGTFEDMRRVNLLLGGTRISLQALERLTGDLSKGDTLSILDIGTGHADIPRSVQEWAGRRAIRLEAIGLDIDYQTLATASALRSNQGIDFLQGDFLALPMSDDSVDVAMSSMTLHHLGDHDAVRALQEMARVSRRGIILNDLMRTIHGYVVAWGLGRIATSNRLTRHDAHRSIQRGRTEAEMAELAERAGLQRPVFDSTLGYRTAMTIGTRPWS